MKHLIFLISILFFGFLTLIIFPKAFLEYNFLQDNFLSNNSFYLKQIIRLGLKGLCVITAGITAILGKSYFEYIFTKKDE